MPQRFPAILLVLVLAAAPAYARTTTTTGSPTTSMTTPVGGCRPDQTLCRIDNRLAALWETAYDANDSLGRLYGPISFRLEKSARCLTRATALCDGRLDADVNRARRKLQRCVRPLAIVQAKLRSRYARRIIPPDLAAVLASEADGLASDFEAARTSLTCQ